ncbi:MAG: SUMF1/EgtB/PvdO family nonheme iron enzyme [Pirellulales bacterium]
MTSCPCARRVRPACCVLLLALVAVASCRRADEATTSSASLPTITAKNGAEMVLVPAGAFTMGSGEGKADEAPAHEVSLDAFWMDRTEVTQKQYAKLVLGGPSHFKGDNRPVEQVSWADAARYCNERSRDEGLEPCYDEQTARCDLRANGYRLPTEAEWEYACRAGSTGKYPFGADPKALKQHAWYAENASKKTQPVAQKTANAWGLFDMLGNVAEWCNDVYEPGYYATSPAANPQGPADGEKYVLRGGAWNSRPEGCRSSARIGEDPGFQDACFARDAIGFRCVRRADRLDASGESKRKESASTPKKDEGMNQTSPKKADARPASKTGFVYGDIYLRHKTPAGHPERPERLTSIVKRLETSGLLAQLTRIEPEPAAEKWLTAVHSKEYLDRIKTRCESGSPYVDSGDTPVCEASYEVALAAVGGVLRAVDAVMEGKVKNAFCAVRPPGHHATRDRAMGFCLLNNVAIAARYAQERHKIARVLIIDWDVHHGNGTQAIFYEDPTVLYFSVHQAPFYPGTGSAAERGKGKGLGSTVNVPLPAGSGDREYRQALEDKLKPAALAFKPELVLISAGFDAHDRDLLGQMKVTAEGYTELTRIARDLAGQCCAGRLVSVLEGGYHLDALAESVESHLRVLML